MASIPLVALNAKAPEQPDIMQKYGQLMALKNAQQQSQQQAAEAPYRMQALQNQAEQGQIALTQAQQAAKDDAATTAALSQYDGKDVNALPGLVIKNGGSARAVFGVKKQLNDWAQAGATLAKTKADGGKAEIDTMQKKYDMVHGALDPLLDPSKVPDANLGQATMQVVQQFTDQGLLDSASAQRVTQLVQAGDPAALRQGIGSFANTLRTHSQVVTEAHNAALEANNQAMRDQAATNAAETARHNAADESLGRGRLSVENARLKFEQQKEENMTGGEPGASGIVDAIGTGKIAVDRLASIINKNPALLTAVTQKYPDFDTSKIKGYVNAVQDYTDTRKGTAGGALNAGATALGHMQELKELNTAASLIPGTSAYQAYQNKANTLAMELASFYGDSTVEGIKSIKNSMTPITSWQRNAAINTQAQSMGDKFDSYEQSWKNAAPSKAYQAPMPQISQKAIEARASLDPKFKARLDSPPAGKITVTAPDGSSHPFDTQAQADEFKKLAGIK